MSTVRGYMKTINGQRVLVREHNRTGEAKKKAGHKGARKSGGGKGPKGRSLARRAWDNTKKSFKHGRKKAKWAALGFGVLALVEITAFLTLNAMAAALITVAALAGAVAYVAVTVANKGGK